MKPLAQFSDLFKATVNLNGHIDTEAAENSIRKNIKFQGPNAWILAIAVIIASVGLNVNSIPVVIGAMLISPLMGPIFGAGLGLGINDMELVKASGKNLLVMVTISLAASFLYFLITPLNLSNPTELLARTNPTIYDVIIALAGGFAGIFEQCRKEKGTVFAGVAIATALMPPLCTAGFGLAGGNFSYFFGAIYLFIINCIFIMLATYISVKYFRFRKTEYADATTEKKTKRISTLLIVLFIVPSIWSAVILVQQNNFDDKAKLFIENCRVFDKTILYDYKIDHTDESVVELFFAGEALSDEAKERVCNIAKEFDIDPDHVVIHQHNTMRDDNDIELIKGIYDKMDSEVARKNAEIARLQEELKAARGNDIPYVQLTREISSSHPSVKEVIITQGAHVLSDSLTFVPCVSVIVRADSLFTQEESSKLSEWLKVRLNDENVIFLKEDL